MMLEVGFIKMLVVGFIVREISKIDRERIITIGQSKCPIGHLARA